MGNVGKAELSYNDDKPKAPFIPVGNDDGLDNNGDVGENIDDIDIASMGYDLNGRLLPGVLGDAGSGLSLFVSGFETGESLRDVGIGPDTGFMAELGTETSLSLPSDTNGRGGEDCGDLDGESEENLLLLNPPVADAVFADKSNTASVILLMYLKKNKHVCWTFCCLYPAGTQYQNDVVHIASTLIRRHFNVVCPLGTLEIQ